MENKKRETAQRESAQKLADFPREVLNRIVPKNEDGERCWVSYADKAKLNLGWV